MTFDDLIADPTSTKIILFELDLPQDSNILVNFTAGIWFRNLSRVRTGLVGTMPLFTTYAADNKENAFSNVASVKVDGSPILAVDSVSDLSTQDGAFYFDPVTTDFYIRFTDDLPPRVVGQVTLGIVTGYANQADNDNNSVYNNTFYDVRLQTVPSLSKNKDPLFFGKTSYQGGSVKLDNQDGELTQLRDADIFGQAVRMKLGFPEIDYPEFKQVFSGYVQDIDYDWQSFSIAIKDPRKNLEQSVQDNVFTTSDYPGIGAETIDSIIPVAYGSIPGGACYLLGGVADDVTGWRYKFVDTTHYDVDGTTTADITVYVDGGAITTASILTVDFTTGVFSIKNSANPGAGSDVNVDFTMDGPVKGFDVLKDVMDKYADLSFISTNFDTVEWAAESANSQDVSLYVNSDNAMTVNDVIEAVGVADNADFFYKDNGQFTGRIFTDDREVTKQIFNESWTGEPKFSQKTSEVVSSYIVKYNQNIMTDRFKQHINDDFEDDVFDTYKFTRSRTVETILATLAGATQKASDIMDRAKRVEDTVTRKTTLEHYDIELMDFIYAQHARESDLDTVDDYGIFEIIGISKTLINNEITLTMKFVKDINVLSYDGSSVLSYESETAWVI